MGTNTKQEIVFDLAVQDDFLNCVLPVWDFGITLYPPSFTHHLSKYILERMFCDNLKDKNFDLVTSIVVKLLKITLQSSIFVDLFIFWDAEL